MENSWLEAVLWRHFLGKVHGALEGKNMNIRCNLSSVNVALLGNMNKKKMSDGSTIYIVHASVRFF